MINNICFLHFSENTGGRKAIKHFFEKYQQGSFDKTLQQSKLN